MPSNSGRKKSQKTCEKRKISLVMNEFKKGQLKTSSGKTVTDSKQAMAIAYSEAKDHC